MMATSANNARLETDWGGTSGLTARPGPLNRRPDRRRNLNPASLGQRLFFSWGVQSTRSEWRPLGFRRSASVLSGPDLIAIGVTLFPR